MVNIHFWLNTEPWSLQLLDFFDDKKVLDIFAGGYSAGYYAYLWSEILDADGFVAFKETGDIYDPVLAARLKKWVYESGGLRDADELYRNFRGQDPSIEPLLEIRGLTEGPKND